MRSADEDVPMSQEELARQFAYARARKEPWDTWESSRPVEDVDEEELREYVQRGNDYGRIQFPFTSVENVLSRLALIRGGKLTNAAEVLFCLSRFVQLKMGMLATHARTEILDLHQEQGTLFSLIRKAEWYILNNTRRRLVIDDIGPRKEIPELPRDAVREVLLNAFTHRDWLSSAAVQIDIYSDAVEISNPGWFIEGQDPAEHLASNSGSSLTRNMLIAQTLYRSGEVEAYGSGIPRVRDACDAAGVRIEYVRTPLGTKFIFHRNDAFDEPDQDDVGVNVGVNDGYVGVNSANVGVSDGNVEIGGSEQILRLLDADPKLSAAKLAERTGLSKRQVERIIASLKKSGTLRRIGSDKAGQWEVVG